MLSIRSALRRRLRSRPTSRVWLRPNDRTSLRRIPFGLLPPPHRPLALWGAYHPERPGHLLRPYRAHLADDKAAEGRIEHLLSSCTPGAVEYLRNRGFDFNRGEQVVNRAYDKVDESVHEEEVYDECEAKRRVHVVVPRIWNRALVQKVIHAQPGSTVGYRWVSAGVGMSVGTGVAAGVAYMNTVVCERAWGDVGLALPSSSRTSSGKIYCRP